MSQFTIKITGLDRLQSAMRPELVTAPLRRLLRDSAVFAEGEARRNAPRDTGALARHMSSSVSPTSARVFNPLVYASVMEEGRRAGGRMPPPAALAGWARRHKIPTDPRTLFVLARAIARRGIKGRFFMRRAAEKLARSEMPRLVRRMAADIERAWRG